MAALLPTPRVASVTWLRDDEARFKLLAWIGEREVTSREVADHTGRSQAVMHHFLEALESEGRIVREIHGKGPTTWRRPRPDPLVDAMSGWGR